MKKARLGEVKGTGKLAVDDPGAFVLAPAIRSFFLDQTYEDGTSERQPGVAILTCRGGQWVLTLKDPTQKVMLKLQAGTYEELCLGADGVLGSDEAPWEHDPVEANKSVRGRRTR